MPWRTSRDTEKEKEALRRDVAAMTAQLKEMEELKERLLIRSKDEAAALRASLATKDAVIKNLQRMLEKLNTNVRDSVDANATKFCEAEPQQDSLAGVATKNEDLLAEKEAMHKVLEDMAVRMDEVMAERDDAAREKEVLRREVAAITAQRNFEVASLKHALRRAKGMRRWSGKGDASLPSCDETAADSSDSDGDSVGASCDESWASDDSTLMTKHEAPQKTMRGKAWRQLLACTNPEHKEGDDGRWVEASVPLR